MKTLTINCYVLKPPLLLQGLKKRGFGQGRYNGFGGKVKPGEDPVAAAKREVLEECGLEVKSLELCGIVNFNYADTNEQVEMLVYKALEFSGEVFESEEMKPEWFSQENLPYNLMWPDDFYWMPLFLAGKKFTAAFVYKGYDVIVKHELKEVEKL